jgi:adenine/guanine phosphoribosyltransferase-like PRPP-binding protein
MKPPRAAWGNFPDVLIHAEESAVKQHPDYPAAKSGDAGAAARLVADTISDEQVRAIQTLAGSDSPVLVSVHAYETSGINAIPEAFADELAKRLGWKLERNIIQTNVVAHTGADGFSRLSRQAAFDGDVLPKTKFFLVDDFVGQGGTLANLRGYIESRGGVVLGASALTGKTFSAKIKLSQTLLDELRSKHGQELERWWESRFGHGFDRLTQSEARYLARSPDADAIRNRIVAAEQAGNSGRSDENEGNVSQLPRRNAGESVSSSSSKSEGNARFSVEEEEPTGHAQPLTAKVLTPSGFKLMGDIHVGDEVITIDGSATKVTDVFPQGKRPIYRVVLSDGSETRTTADHLWAIRFDDGTGVMSTASLMKGTEQGLRFRVPEVGRWSQASQPTRQKSR